MLSVYLCDDNTEELTFLKSEIEKYIMIAALDFQVVCAAASVSELLLAMPEKAQSAVYFLDVELDELTSGIKLAAQIRERDPRAYIIFTTTHEEMAMVTFRYKVEALDYLIKDQPDYIERIHQCLDNILQKSCQSAPSPGHKLHFHLPERDLLLSPDEIYYFQTDDAHRISIHTTNGIYQCSLSLKAAAELCPDFFQCHKSLLINPTHLRAVQKSPCTVILDNGTSCPCAVRQYKKALSLLQNLAQNKPS